MMVSVGVVAIMIGTGSVVALLRLEARIKQPPPVAPAPPTQDPRVDTLVEALKDLTILHADLRLVVADGISHVAKSEKRINSALKRARAVLEEGGVPSGALEAEYEDLREFYDDGSGQEEMRLMPEAVEQDQPSSIPGISLAMMRRARGR